MARALTSLVLALALCGLVLAQAFGRFGYSEAVSVPGLSVSREGFSARNPVADMFRFVAPAKQWKPAQTSDVGQTILLSDIAECPSKMRVNLAAPGATYYFPKGLSLRLRSTGAPYLSWKEGTVGPDVPTPDSSWVLVSFKDAQPPVLIAFLDAPAAAKIVGKPGDWTLTTDKPFKGWIRVALPVGTEAVTANTAASLGQLSERVAKNENVWAKPDPKLVGVHVDGDNTAVQVTWTYDRAGVIVPAALDLAKVGGYLIRLQSPVARLDAGNEEGPVSVTLEPTLTLRFPVRRIPTGRCVTLGERSIPGLATVSPIDIPSVVEMALENLLCDRDLASHKAAEETLSAYLLEADYTLEPFTNQQLPYGPTGDGIDLAAAHSLLMEVLSTATEASSEDNSLLTSVCWRRDWYSWRLWLPDPAVRRRASALAALAGAICPEPQRRLDAAMLEAGLAAERGLAILQARAAKKDPPPNLIEPMGPLRDYLFFKNRKAADEDPFAKCLVSEVRVFGDTAVQATNAEGKIKLSWSVEDRAAGVVTFAAAYPIELSNGNLATFEPAQALGFSRFRYVPAAPGTCEVWLKTPTWAKPIPATAPVPHYSEPPK